MKGSVHSLLEQYCIQTLSFFIHRSVGVLTYMLLSGCSPFAGADKMETFSNITQARVDFPEELFQHSSQLAKDFIVKLLKRNPR